MILKPSSGGRAHTQACFSYTPTLPTMSWEGFNGGVHSIPYMGLKTKILRQQIVTRLRLQGRTRWLPHYQNTRPEKKTSHCPKFMRMRSLGSCYFYLSQPRSVGKGKSNSEGNGKFPFLFRALPPRPWVHGVMIGAAQSPPADLWARCMPHPAPGALNAWTRMVPTITVFGVINPVLQEKKQIHSVWLKWLRVTENRFHRKLIKFSFMTQVMCSGLDRRGRTAGPQGQGQGTGASTLPRTSG